MRRALLCAAALALPPAAAATPQAPPAMTITLTPAAMREASGTGSVAVDVALSAWQASAGTQLFHLGLGAPGMREPQPVDEFRVTDTHGDVPLDTRVVDGTSEWFARRAVSGAVRAHYVLPISNARGSNPPVALRIDGDAFSSPGRALVAVPAIDAARVSIRWNLAAMGAGAVGVSSWGDGDVTPGLLPIEKVELSLFMAGHLHRLATGRFAAVWAGTPPFDPHPAMAWTAKLHGWMSRFFGDTSEPPYRVFLRGNPQNPGGGAAMTHSFVVGYGAGTTGDSLTYILGHEMTHTWTAIESAGKWYSEGNAVYYQTQLPWRAGLLSTADYLSDLNLTASRYYTDAMRDTPEDQVLPHFWDDTRIRVLPYDRGALYFAALNGMLKRRTEGRRSIDDLIFAMDRRHDAGEVLHEADWAALIGKEIGPEAVALHRTMMSGGLVLPESGDFGPCFRRIVKPIRRFDIGFDTGSLIGDKIVRGLVLGSEAEKAGLRNGDRIVSINAGDAVQRDVTRTTTLKAIRDGAAFTFVYLPRGKVVDAYQWERVPDVPDSACRPAGLSPIN